MALFIGPHGRLHPRDQSRAIRNSTIDVYNGDVRDARPWVMKRAAIE